MVVWGFISGATGGVQSYGGLIACRYVEPLDVLANEEMILMRLFGV